MWGGVYSNAMDRTGGWGLWPRPPMVSIRFECIPPQLRFILSFNGCASKRGLVSYGKVSKPRQSYLIQLKTIKQTTQFQLGGSAPQIPIN